MKTTVRVPRLKDWPAFQWAWALHREGDRELFLDFLERMYLVFCFYDEREQLREKTSENPDKPRTWAVLLLADENGIGHPILCGVPFLAKYPSELARLRRSMGLVFEKTSRLARQQASHGHIAASQSANEEKEEYGGSLWLPGDVEFLGARQVALSGLPGGLADEAGLLSCLTGAEIMKTNQAGIVCAATSNGECAPLEEYVKRNWQP